MNDDERLEDSVIRNFRITATDGKTYETKHYNLQMIIAWVSKLIQEEPFSFVNG